jgi:hypothetical protein
LNTSLTLRDKIELMRDVETEWLAHNLGRSIANLGYPVGMGIAPHEDALQQAAAMLFERFIAMAEFVDQHAPTTKEELAARETHHG